MLKSGGVAGHVAFIRKTPLADTRWDVGSVQDSLVSISPKDASWTVKMTMA